MGKRISREDFVINKVMKHLDIIRKDLKDGRHISAIISGIGMIYSYEHKIAYEYLNKIGVLSNELYRNL